MDIQDQLWLEDIVKFRANMKNIEIIVTNVTDSVFEHVGHVEESIEALGALYNYTKRETLEPLFNKKIRYVSNFIKFVKFLKVMSADEIITNKKLRHLCKIVCNSGSSSSTNVVKLDENESQTNNFAHLYLTIHIVKLV